MDCFCYQEINLKKNLILDIKSKIDFLKTKIGLTFFISNMFLNEKICFIFFLYQGFDFLYIKNSIF